MGCPLSLGGKLLFNKKKNRKILCFLLFKVTSNAASLAAEFYFHDLFFSGKAHQPASRRICHRHFLSHHIKQMQKIMHQR